MNLFLQMIMGIFSKFGRKKTTLNPVEVKPIDNNISIGNKPSIQPATRAEIDPIAEDPILQPPHHLPTNTNWKEELLKVIKEYYLPDNQYYKTTKPKKQIYIHHTAGNPNPYGVVDWWKSNSEHVGTFCVIGGKPTRSSDRWKDGEIVQCFGSKYWAYHLYISARGNRISSEYKTRWNDDRLNSESIGIEICNWGPLTYKNGKFYTYVNTEVPKSEVVEYSTPYRGYKYYHKYTDAQIASLKLLLMYLTEEYDISRAFQPNFAEISTGALAQRNGIFTHTSVRTDKTDCHPQPELIEMLKTLQ